MSLKLQRDINFTCIDENIDRTWMLVNIYKIIVKTKLIIIYITFKEHLEIIIRRILLMLNIDKFLILFINMAHNNMSVSINIYRW